jgi:hypothetical protein
MQSRLYMALRKDYLALGQVCQQLYHECRSLDAQELSPFIIDMEELTHMLPLLLEPFTSVYHDKITIVFPESHENNLDILPLMRSIHDAPNVEIEVSTAGNYHNIQAADYQRMLFAERGSLCAKIIPAYSCHLTQVLLRVGGYYKFPSPEITFKSQYALLWMTGEDLKPADWRRERTTKAFPQTHMERVQQMRLWLEEAGMPLDERKNCDMAMHSQDQSQQWMLADVPETT